ncbi:transporter [Flavobacterium album]|uniref:Transporter n=1 Tax=Flavobacterium album TaxID=2175091 RepID=A0A2S1QUF1_9FLAO|nr:TolC family protein [Flavobacterium album]AWH83959.1 transporter [Flavobacterium album]
MKSKFYAAFLFVFALFADDAYGQAKKWTLQECVEYALKNNISIKLTELDARLANVSRKDAKSAFLPTAQIQGSHSWNIGLNQNITTGLLENQTTQFTSVGLNMGVDIYNGLQNQNRLRRANLAAISAQYQTVKMQEDVALNVANAYLQVLFNKENLKVQEQQLAFDTRQMQRVGELVEGGAVPRGDLLDVKATVAADNQKKIAAENALLISKLSLAQLMQLEDFQNFDTEDGNYDVKDEPILLEQPATIYNKAKEQRTELKIARTNVEVAEKDVKIAKGAYQPVISGFYSLTTRAAYSDRIVGFAQSTTQPTSVVGFVDGTNQLVLQNNYQPILGRYLPILDQFDNNKGHSFGVGVNVPIFNGFAVRNNVERTKVELERSQITLEQRELDLERNVYTAYTDAQGALKAYDAAVSAAEARTEALTYAQERYEVGLINVFDLNQAQTLSVNAQSEVLRTKYDYIFRIKILEFYFGIPISQISQK